MNIECLSRNQSTCDLLRGPETLKDSEKLYDACRENDLKAALQLLSLNTLPNYICPTTKWTSLHWAIFHEKINLIKAILNAGNIFLNFENEMLIEFKKSGPEVGLENKGQMLSRSILYKTLGYSKNSPLILASRKGNASIVWLLLKESFSPNDVDDIGNNSLHAAAMGGHVKVLDALIKDGGNTLALNCYKNSPADVSVCNNCSLLLRNAEKNFIKGLEYQMKMHQDNMNRVFEIEQHLQMAIERNKDGIETCSKADGEASLLILADIEEELENKISEINFAVEQAQEIGICNELVKEAIQRQACLVIHKKIEKQMRCVMDSEPILTQTQYSDLVNPLLYLISQCTSPNPAYELNSKIVKRANEIALKSYSEYWLHASAQNLIQVECASEQHVQGLSKLDNLINEAKKCNCFPSLIAQSESLSFRLHSELEVQRSYADIPVVRLAPVLAEGQKKFPKNFMKNYWKEEDFGHIFENEGYPLPPKNDEGVELEYSWVSSESLQSLKAAERRIHYALIDGKKWLANESILKQGALKLEALMKNVVQLEEKDAEDRAKCIKAAEKAAKKIKKSLKKGKKKPKKNA